MKVAKLGQEQQIHWLWCWDASLCEQRKWEYRLMRRLAGQMSFCLVLNLAVNVVAALPLTRNVHKSFVSGLAQLLARRVAA